MKSVFLGYALPAYIIYLVSYGPLLLLYRYHPYFVGLLSPQTFGVFRTIFFVYLICGLQYFWINGILAPGEVKKFRTMVDSLRTLLTKKTMTEVARVYLLKIILKGFWAPLMLNYMFFHYGRLTGLYSLPHPELSTFDWGYQFIYSSIFFVDTVIFSFSYMIETHWLKNSIVSVEPTLAGWMVALITYEPFNSITGRFLPLTYQNGMIIPFWGMRTIQVATLACFALYGWASVALLFKGSNLTNRGIVTWGPYRYLRHPAYIGKNLGWWLETVPYLNNPGNILSLVGFNLIYFLRAVTEERHLMRTSEYRSYQKKTSFWGVRVPRQKS